MQPKSSQRGFTLVELMVAIAVLAVVGSAVFYSNNRAINQQNILEHKTIASWVLQNQIAYLHLDRRINREDPRPVSSQTNQVQFGARSFSVVVSPSVADASIGNTQLIRVSIYEDSADSEDIPLHEIETYISLE